MSKWEVLPLAVTMLLAIFAGWRDSMTPVRFVRLKFVALLYICLLILLQYHALWPLWDGQFFDFAFTSLILVCACYVTGLALGHGITEHKYGTPAP